MSDNYWNEINQNTTNDNSGFLQSIFVNYSVKYEDEDDKKIYTRYTSCKNELFKIYDTRWLCC